MRHLIDFALFENVESHSNLAKLADMLIDDLVSRNTELMADLRPGKFFFAFTRVSSLPVTGKGLNKDAKAFLKKHRVYVMLREREKSTLGVYYPESRQLVVYIHPKDTERLKSIIDKHYENKHQKAHELQSVLRHILVSMRETLIHELQHAWDDYNSEGRFIDGGLTTDMAETDYEGYLKLSHEINARYTQTVSILQTQGLVYDEFGHVSRLPLTWDNYLRVFKHHFKGWQLLDGKQQKRLAARLSQHFQQLKDQKKTSTDITEKVERLNTELKGMGVESHVYFTDFNNLITISKLLAQTEEAEADALGRIIRIADIYRKDIVVTPHRRHTGIAIGTFKKLLKGRGFRENRGSRYDYRTRESMIRYSRR
jgi:hypothetical protein